MSRSHRSTHSDQSHHSKHNTHNERYDHAHSHSDRGNCGFQFSKWDGCKLDFERPAREHCNRETLQKTCLSHDEFYVIRPEPPLEVAIGGVWGDPIFVGQDGGSYYVNGEAGKVYNILSDAGYQLNALFSPLSDTGEYTVVSQAGLTIGELQIQVGLNGELLVNGEHYSDGDYNFGAVAISKTDGTIAVVSDEYTTTFLSTNLMINMTFRGENVTADGVLPSGLWGVSVDEDWYQRNGIDAVNSPQGGNGIEDLEGNIIAADDVETYRLYAVSDLFDTGFVNFNRFNATTDNPLNLPALDENQSIILDVLANDGNAGRISRFSETQFGELTLLEDGSFLYIADAGFSGDDSFSYTVVSANGVELTATATIHVVTMAEAAQLTEDDLNRAQDTVCDAGLEHCDRSMDDILECYSPKPPVSCEANPDNGSRDSRDYSHSWNKGGRWDWGHRDFTECDWSRLIAEPGDQDGAVGYCG